MMAEEFNEYFTSVFNTEDLNNLPEVGNKTINKVEAMDITRDGVRRVLRRLKEG